MDGNRKIKILNIVLLVLNLILIGLNVYKTFISDNIKKSSKTAVEYIKELYDDASRRAANGLKKDNTSDENIRYEGANPNNYVLFNDELWRIIGVFEGNIKLIRSEELGQLSWDSSDFFINFGLGVNEWSQADLKEYLNTMYYGGMNVTCYGNKGNATTTCPTGNLNLTAKSMIDYHMWNIGIIGYFRNSKPNQITVALYNDERGTSNDEVCSGGPYCNDGITRTTTWQGYVALPYATDWAYASSEIACATNINDGYDAANYNKFDNMTCKKNNWMHHGSNDSEAIWMLSPFAHSDDGRFAWAVFGDGNTSIGNASDPFSIFPSLYLKSDVKISSGSGTSGDPYILEL